MDAKVGIESTTRGKKNQRIRRKTHMDDLEEIIRKIREFKRIAGNRRDWRRWVHEVSTT